MKNTNKKTRLLSMFLALCTTAMLASCAAAPADSGYADASEPSSIPYVEIQEEPVPSASFDTTVTDVHSEKINGKDDHTQDADDEIDYIRFMKDADYAGRCIAKSLAKVAGLKSKPERYDSACVVDMRKSETAYDADWDYGDEYEQRVGMYDWEEVFDAEYYMKQFPMLALQYHYDEDQLLRHFQTVGIHEGRQGCENFNVGAYMDWCKENRDYVVDLFDGDYALYYMFYMSSVGGRPEKFPADGHPVQYKAILTLAQQKELDGINKYREKTGAEPLVFDPEMAAFANYRSWMNQEKEYIGHAWVEAPGNDDIIDLYFNTTSADLISENTLETSMLAVKAWCDVYADSKLHYEAMIDDNYKYVGSSNLYIDDVAIRTHKNRGVQFDIFAGSLSTPINH